MAKAIEMIARINDELAQGNITLRNRIRRMGKGMPVEAWDIAQLERLCSMCHISLISSEENAAINQREADVMAQRGIKHAIAHDPWLEKLDSEDITAMTATTLAKAPIALVPDWSVLDNADDN